MKKILIALTIIMFSTSFIIAGQIQIRPMVGYGLGVHQQTIVMQDGGVGVGAEVEIDTTGTKTKDANIYYSGGAGLNFGLGILIGLTENLGVELGGGYVLGSEKEVYKKTDNSTSPVTTESYKNKSSYIPIDVTLKIMKELGQITPYVGFGPTIAVAGKTIMTYKKESNVTEEIEWEYTYNTGFGWNAVLGADYKMSDSMSIFLSLTLHEVALRLDTGKKTKHTIDGTDQLAGQTTSQKEIEFKEDNPDNPSATPNDPTVQNTFALSFSSLDIRLGIAIGF